MNAVKGMLDRIVSSTLEELDRRREKVPTSQVAAAACKAEPARDFVASLRPGTISIIAEVKRASPSKGWLNRSLDAAAQARSYARGGAAAISVLTEPVFFHGSFADLEAAKGATELPVLCKDFIVDPYQVFEARLHGADAVLLIAAILSDGALRTLRELARGLGMQALVEVHDERDMEKALASGARVVGINNRNLSDFTVDLNTTLRLRPLLPPSVVVVSESGISSRSDIVMLERAGVHAVLVGESLVTAADPAAKIRELLGVADD
ncbi:MAG: indole-3-glycerol phosphate synthase TrpC [Chloroflexota bacterium]